jgi:hypothetical protein
VVDKCRARENRLDENAGVDAKQAPGRVMLACEVKHH